MQDSDGFRDLGAKETFRNGSERVGREIELGGARNSASKREFEDPFAEDTDTVNGSLRTMKTERVGAEKGSLSVKIARNAEGNGSSKRKLRDLGDFIEKPVALDSFQGIKSSGKAASLENSNVINGFGREKQATAGGADKASALEEIVDNAGDKKVSGEIKILSYNVWFREDLEVHRRMQAVGDLIQLHTPDVICFQEVTPNIYSILQKSTWWKRYHCSVSYERAASEAYFCMQLAKLPVKSFRCKPFSNTAMCRELCIAEVEVTKDKSLVIATTHLESPCPGPPTWDQMFSKERVNQAKEAIAFLQKYPNVIFCGDMNWDDKLDGQFPFVEGWFDAWEKLRPSEIGWTYDTKSNKMLTGNRTLQKRLDRFICYLPDFKIGCMEMIGTDPIPGLTYSKQKKMKNKIQELTLPVLPSDHYGLLLTFSGS